MPGKIKKHLECKCFFLCQRRNFVENSLNRGIFTSSDTIYQFGNDIVSEKYSVARKSDFVAVRFEISLVGKSGKLFAENRKEIDAELFRILAETYAALLHCVYKRVQHAVFGAKNPASRTNAYIVRNIGYAMRIVIEIIFYITARAVTERDTASAAATASL